jgi:hypothetical protein
MKALSSLIIMLLLIGCASVELASQTKDESAKSFIVQEGKANIYTVYAGGYMSSTTNFQVSVDGKQIGSLAGWTYRLSVVDPGPHTVVATGLENEEGFKLKAEAGKNYFVALRSSIGWKSHHVGLSQLDEVEGKQAILKGNLAKAFFSNE